MNISINQKTLSKTALSQAIRLLPTAVRYYKKHIAGVGYVIFFKDKNELTVGRLFEDGADGVVLDPRMGA